MANNKTKLEKTQDSYFDFLNEIKDCFYEERQLALDRYRRAENEINSPEEFMLLGKVSVSYLNAASEASKKMLSLSEQMNKILFKEEESANQVNVLNQFGNADKQAVVEISKELIKERRLLKQNEGKDLKNENIDGSQNSRSNTSDSNSE